MKCSCVLPVHLLKLFENGNVKQKTFYVLRVVAIVIPDGARSCEKHEIEPVKKKNL